LDTAAWGIAAAIVAALAGVLVAVVSIIQITLARRGATLAAIQPFYVHYHSGELRRIRGELYSGRLDLGALQDVDKKALEELINSLEFLGALVNNQLVSFKVVRSIFHSSIPDLWPYVRPYVLARRAQGVNPRPLYARNYELLAARYGLRLS